MKSRDYISGVGTMGSFWTSTLSSSSNEAKRLIIFNGDAKELGVSVYERWIGYPIRPVYAE